MKEKRKVIKMSSFGSKLTYREVSNSNEIHFGQWIGNVEIVLVVWQNLCRNL